MKFTNEGRDCIEQYKLYRNNHKTYGSGFSYRKHHTKIAKIVEDTKSTSLLDFGCGFGIQYTKEHMHNDWGFMPTLYDPAIARYELLPTQMFDGIYSTDVLEHIPESQLPETLKYILEHANKFVYLGICNSVADVTLPDGKNAHITQRGLEWWVNIIKKYNTKKVATYLNVYGEGHGLRSGYRVLNNPNPPNDENGDVIPLSKRF